MEANSGASFEQYFRWARLEQIETIVENLYKAKLSEVAEIEYKCTDFYDPSDELQILWNDPAIGVAWPLRTPILSDKDRAAPRVADISDLLPWFGVQQTP